MSNYDPFRLYDYKQKKSHKGQVLRKKFVGHPLPNVLTPEQLKEAKQILEDIGYTVTRDPIPTLNETHIRSFIYCDEFNNVEYRSGNKILSLSDVWNSKINDFQDLFVPSIQLNSFSFEINVISYHLCGSFDSAIDSQNALEFRLYNAVDYKPLYVKPYTGYRQGGIAYFALSPNYVVISGGFDSPNDNTYDFGGSVESQRQYSYPYLYHYSDNSIETYNSIVNSDFSNYNPILMQIGLAVPTAISGTSATVTSTYVTYQITMAINTNI